jgi:uridine kinase
MQHALFDDIRALLNRRTESSTPTFILIDGPAGAGKTTLAKEIVTTMGVGEIIHCDDLYNGWDDALTPTLEHTIKEQILIPMQEKAPVNYRKYDWVAGRFGELRELPATPLIILEGVGCALPSVANVADLSIWIDIPFDLGLERVLNRDGAAIGQEMMVWITRQDEFFAAHRNRENCAIHLPYGAPAQP